MKTILAVLALLALAIPACGYLKDQFPELCAKRKGASLVKNGYTDLRVFIDPNVKEDPEIIDGTKGLITKASEMLFKATKQRVYYDTVRIIIPSTWKHKDEYQTATSKDRDFENSDFKVAAMEPKKGYRIYPHKSILECGREGEYIHITPETAVDYQNYKRVYQVKQLVQSWAEHRYGVFNEFFDDSMVSSKMFNYPFDWHICLDWVDPDATSCPLLRPPKHGYYVDENQARCHPCKDKDPTYDLDDIPPACHNWVGPVPKSFDTSLGYTTSDDSLQVDMFCDEHTHNDGGISLHNSRCARLSWLQIIDQSIDFDVDHACPESAPLQPAKEYPGSPKFTLIQTHDSNTLAFVLDISGSMRGQRIDALIKAVAATFDCIADGTKIGVTTFSTSAATLIPLTDMDRDSRKDMQSKVHQLSSGGNTALGQGILEALKLLPAGTEAKGAHLVVVSDGEENEAPMSSSPQVQQALQRDGVYVDAVGISNQAPQSLHDLTDQYSGQFLFIDTTSTQSQIPQAVAKLCQLASKVDHTSQVIFTEDLQTKNGSFDVDRFVGATIALSFTTHSGSIDVVLTLPGGGQLSKDNTTVYSKTGATVSFRVPLPETGSWAFKITESHVPLNLQAPVNETSMLVKNELPSERLGRPDTVTADTGVTLQLSSSGKRNDTTDATLPLVLKGYFSQTDTYDIRDTPVVLFARLAVGESAVIGAKVAAKITVKSGVMSLTLRDDGKESDSLANDGIYSGMLTDFSGMEPGQTLKVSVSTVAEGNDKTEFIVVEKEGDKELKRKAIKTGAFVRRIDNPALVLRLPAEIKDFSPPDKVNDVAAVAHVDEKLIGLSWTSVSGNEGKNTTASSYSLRFSFVGAADLAVNFTECGEITDADIAQGSLIPETAGLMQNMKLATVGNETLEVGKKVYFAVKAFNADNNKQGKMSNVASVVFEKPPEKPNTSPPIVLTTGVVWMALVLRQLLLS